MQRNELSKIVRSWLGERFETQEQMNTGVKHKSGHSDPNQPQESIPVETRSCPKESQEISLESDEMDRVKEGVLRKLLSIM
tara:strand:+ start:217 stop:459 length:243 start_codon:yes stop_codon:yes gene_type:complete